MPVFQPGGPVIPDELAQALEDDDLILFCGAGLSMQAGLPDFPGLVGDVYAALGEPPPSLVDARNWPDRMLGEVERKYGVELFRQRLVECLAKPPLSLAIHEAVIRLATTKVGGCPRLVSTNFDIYLPEAAKRLKIAFEEHDAPALPVPRNDKPRTWRSMVHLHGKLRPIGRNEHLVVSSADFGRAYLKDGYAARFIVELVDSFSVLFIGYSLNDPVMRYIMDAFAAERAARREISRHRAHIFVADNAGVAAEEWERRGVTPIYYSAKDGHRELRETLTAWAEARVDWLSSKEKVVRAIALKGPGVLDPSDRANLTWALAGDGPGDFYGVSVLSALGSQAPASWLALFEEHDQQVRSAKPGDPKARQATLMAGLSTDGGQEAVPTPVEREVANWLVQHLEAPEMLEWALGQWQRERHLTRWLTDLIRRRLTAEPKPLHAHEVVWRVLSGATFRPRSVEFMHSMATVERFVRASPPTAELRLELLALLEPQLALRPATDLRRALASIVPSAPETPPGLPDSADTEGAKDGKSAAESAAEGAPADREEAEPVARSDNLKVRDLIFSEVRIIGDEYLDALWREDGAWKSRGADLASIAGELTSLLLKGLELWASVERADETYDPGIFDRPSIAPHPQNHNFQSWTRLIDLLWAAWLHIDAMDVSDSRALVERWRRLKYPTFQRMVLAAIAHSRHWSKLEKLEMILG